MHPGNLTPFKQDTTLIRLCEQTYRWSRKNTRVFAEEDIYTSDLLHGVSKKDLDFPTVDQHIVFDS